MAEVASASAKLPKATITVNGVRETVEATPDRSLLSTLRHELGLTGAKYGCGEGECGACTVLLDGRPVHACKVKVSEASGREVVTIEGIAPDGRLTPVQRAFLDLGAFQCGFCTPGMIVAATALLREHPDPTDDELLRAMDGNLCRCCGYPRIVRALRSAAEQMRSGGRGP